MCFVTKSSPLFGIGGLIGVTRVLLRWSCNFSAALEVSYFWQLSLADAPLHLQIDLRWCLLVAWSYRLSIKITPIYEASQAPQTSN